MGRNICLDHIEAYLRYIITEEKCRNIGTDFTNLLSPILACKLIKEARILARGPFPLASKFERG